MQPRLVVATDGSCLGNPGVGGWAWAVDEECWAAGSHQRTTNNLMELRAVFEALAIVPTDLPLVFEVDSEYVIETFTEWIEGWRARGWRTSGRKAVANQEAIRQVARLLQGRNVVWRHVRGHAGHRLNEIADSRARAAAIAQQSGRPVNEGNAKCVERWIKEVRGEPR